MLETSGFKKTQEGTIFMVRTVYFWSLCHCTGMAGYHNL